MRAFLFILIILPNILLCQSVDEYINNASKIHNANPDSAYQLCKKAQILAIKQNDTLQMAYCNLCEVRYFLLKNKLEDAANKLEKAHSIFSKKGNKKGLAKTYIAMSNIAGRIKKDEQEIIHLEEAYRILKEIKDTVGILKTLTNLALNYTHYGDLDEAENALTQLEILSEGMPQKEYYYLNQNWGIFYNAKGEFESALRRYNVAKSIAEDLEMTDSKATITLLISQTYLKQNNNDKALEFASISFNIAVENDLTIEKLEALEQLNKIYELNHNVDKAYLTYKQIVDIKEDIYNLKKINKLNDYERKIELSEKEKIIVNQKLDIEKQNNQLLKDKYQFYILFAVLGVILISLILVYINLKNKKKANKIISLQKEEVEKQKQIVDDKNFQIMSSITYAKRIQEAILPQDKLVKEYLERSFIFYKAKDIVSGDFYWMEQIGNKILFAAVDCTGHGVPGAFMSIVGNNGLNKAVRELKLTKPSLILDALNLHLQKSLHLDTSDVKDGMDIALCLLDLDTNVLEYSGAFNPLYLIRKESNDIEIVRANKQPIGNAVDLFKNHEIQLSKGDLIYIFTDGYPDQFGGINNKKFGFKNFRELILKMRNNSMAQQREIIEQKFQLWKGDEEQIDDICVIGVRV